MRLSDWTEQTLRLPAEVSALPGPVRLYPYQREIADTISDPAIERVSIIKSARVGYTTLLTAALGHFVVNDPSAILSVLPAEADCRRYVVDDVEPIFSATPELANVLSGDVDDGKKNRNTIESRRFIGGFWKVVASTAPRNLRAHTIRVLFLDEVDGMKVSKEGDPVDLAIRRTMSYDDRKIIMGSTPVHEATSFILQAYEKSDKRVFEAPCPHCGARHEIRWKDIHWPEGEPANAYWACPDCGGVVEDADKREFLAGGAWRATSPHVKGHAGFRLSALISPLANAAWGKLACEFVEAKKDPKNLQTFVNTILGEPWKGGGEELDEEEIAARAEDFNLDAIPDDVLHITCGVDVQPDRLEATLVGFSEDGTASALAHEVFWGSVIDGDAWTQLDDLLKRKWAHPLGGEIGISATCVDSSDGNTMEAVYRFCGPRFARRVYAIKGDEGRRPWIEKSKTNPKGGCRLFIVGVDSIKSVLFPRIKAGLKFKASNTLPPVWFEQLTGEQIVTRKRMGRDVHAFVPVPGRRHEALDCMVYAHAASEMVPRISAETRRSELATPPAVAEVVRRRPPIQRSEWMDRL